MTDNHIAVRELPSTGRPAFLPAKSADKCEVCVGKIFLVSCVSRKTPHSVAARDLYISDWFRKAKAYVEGEHCPWYILSAQYGLLHPDTIVDPYDKTLRRMSSMERKTWAAGVARQLAAVLHPEDRVVMLAGDAYRHHLMPHILALTRDIDVPMQGLRIGEQMRWLGRAQK